MIKNLLYIKILLFITIKINGSVTLDTTFNPSGTGGTEPGTLTTVIGTTSQINRIAIQSDLKIIAAGITTTGVTQRIALARYLTDGTLDSSFNGTGVVTTLIGAIQTSANSVKIQSDGKIVTAGSATIPPNRFALVRYNTNGTLDTTGFGSPNGFVTTSILSASIANDLAIQTDNKIVAVGLATSGPTTSFALARYNTNGSLDTTGFGSPNGFVTTTINSFARILSVALQPDGKIVVAGASGPNSSSTVLTVARYLSNGLIDSTANDPSSSFGTNGFVTLNNFPFSIANSVILQSNGKIVVGGSGGTSASNGTFLLARYNTNGTLDSSFGDAGIVTTQIGSNSSISQIILDSNNKIIAGGFSTLNSIQRFTITRYDVFGKLDESFGIVTTLINNSSILRSIALQTSQKLVAGGASSLNGLLRFTLARYTIQDECLTNLNQTIIDKYGIG